VIVRDRLAAVPPDPSSVLVPGPWTHRDVGANGQKFHVAELGEGPLVLLLHGFPQFWWAWRDQLTGLAAKNYRAVAVDLRGYGASDKPPRGYDGYTLSSDIAGLVRALGEHEAVIVGHGWGGFLGWSVAALHPRVVRRLVVLSMPHPLRLRQALFTPGQQMRAAAHVYAFQAPWQPERALVADDAEQVAHLIRSWAGPDYPLTETLTRYRQHAQIPGVVHSALEYYRWMVRSQFRPDGARFARRMNTRIDAPTLQIHGIDDPCMLASTARGIGTLVGERYELVELAGVGHFPAEERPTQITELIADWAGRAR
jgi:pimeloyl-ACP methyl ester carboxylesterase